MATSQAMFAADISKAIADMAAASTHLAERALLFLARNDVGERIGEILEGSYMQSFIFIFLLIANMKGMRSVAVVNYSFPVKMSG